eukprot:7459-Heterococcus_DN1.PRE.3
MQQQYTCPSLGDRRRSKFKDNPGNLYVSDSEESSEDDDLDDHEEALNSPGGGALSSEVSASDTVIEYAVLKHCNIEHGPGSIRSAQQCVPAAHLRKSNVMLAACIRQPVAKLILLCTSKQQNYCCPFPLHARISHQREAFSLAGSSDAPQPTTSSSSRRHGHRLFNRRRKSETHAQSASMQSAAAVAAADSPVNGANASGSDRKRGIGRGLFVRRQHSPPLDAGTGQHYSIL